MMDILLTILWAGVATAGFAILFQTPRTNLPYCIAAGMLGFAMRQVLVANDLNLEMASFFGATAIGIASLLFARYLRVPASSISVSAVIPLIPGRLAFETVATILLSITQNELAADTMAELTFSGIRVALILIALGVGVLLPTMLIYREAPVTK